MVTGEVDQRVKALATNPDDMSLILTTHMAEKENQLLKLAVL